MNTPAVSANNPSAAGNLASEKVRFGEFGRFAVFAVHTRFDAVQWLVADAEVTDETTGFAAVVRQCETFEEAVRGLS